MLDKTKARNNPAGEESMVIVNRTGEAKRYKNPKKLWQGNVVLSSASAIKS
ncbi:MAG TPA: hypothetical protein VID27_11155 [Blastocatellia bacterium]